MNAAKNRLTAQQNLAAMQNRLDDGLLTDAQRAELADEVSSTEIAAPVIETYALNTAPVNVTILDGATLEEIGSATLTRIPSR